MTEERPRPIPAKTLIKSLIKAGIVHENTTRVILDLDWTKVPVLYVEQYGDSRLLNLIQDLDGIHIEWAEATQVKEQDDHT